MLFVFYTWFMQNKKNFSVVYKAVLFHMFNGEPDQRSIIGTINRNGI